MDTGKEDGADWPGDWYAALAALAWQVDLGVSEAVGDVPVNRYDLPATTPTAMPAAVLPGAALQDAGGSPMHGPMASPAVLGAGESGAGTVAVAIAAANTAAARAKTLEALRDAMAGYEHCSLKRGARNLVFGCGDPAARVLILGEAPGKDEDVDGQPFMGRAGQLLDRMLAAIGLSRAASGAAEAVYLTQVLPWRPPADRAPDADELAMMLPFVRRHIALIDPEVVVVAGNTPLLALTGAAGILRARGQWTHALGKPVLPMLHPGYLLNTPAAKREAWADLLALKARLRSGATASASASVLADRGG